jgi:peptidoglycan/LPS O-acetylase OafA/YrhL
MAATTKDIPLEALRGLAAVTVLLWHTMLGFFPQWLGLFPGWPAEAALNGQVWFGLIHGTAAVTLFFVLSGFVLTRRFLTSGDQHIIVRGIIKRWPRLAGPVVVTTLTSWLLFKLGLYGFAEGGAMTGSPWLSKFASAFDVPFEPSIWDSVSQGAFLTFFRGDFFYDSSLWTMRYEFIGSFVSFGLAMLIVLLPEEARFLRVAVIAVVFALCDFASPIYGAFPAGVALAAFLPERRDALPGWAVAASILAAVYLFGFTGVSTGAFVPIAWALKNNVVPTHIVASVLVIAAIELAPPPFRSHLSSRLAERLGRLSFPLYLIHVPVLCSLGCATLIWSGTFLSGTWAAAAWPNIIAAAATIAGAVAAAIPLAYFNDRWVTFVNAATNRLLAQPSWVGTAAAKLRH